MVENPHYKELLLALNEYEVEYLIVGGYAVMKYTEPRYTKDLDVWVHNSSPNAEKVFHALVKFGAPLKHDGITPKTFSQDNIVGLAVYYFFGRKHSELRARELVVGCQLSVTS